jgi:hypothetical protein
LEVSVERCNEKLLEIEVVRVLKKVSEITLKFVTQHANREVSFAVVYAYINL